MQPFGGTICTSLESAHDPSTLHLEVDGCGRTAGSGKPPSLKTQFVFCTEHVGQPNFACALIESRLDAPNEVNKTWNLEDTQFTAFDRPALRAVYKWHPLPTVETAAQQGEVRVHTPNEAQTYLAPSQAGGVGSPTTPNRDATTISLSSIRT